jgi:hypothetical protein
LWREGFNLPAQRVVEAYFVHRSPDGVLRQRINVRLYPRLPDSRNEEGLATYWTAHVMCDPASPN